MRPVSHALFHCPPAPSVVLSLNFFSVGRDEQGAVIHVVLNHLARNSKLLAHRSNAKPSKCAAEEVQTRGEEQLEVSEQGGEAKMEQTKSLRSSAQALSGYGVPSSSDHA
ncbi:hypothetical protein VPH35_029200 [Triticum aestivum]